LPGCRTTNVSTSESGLESRCALCEAIELAGPHFDFVVPVNDVVAWLEAAVMKILVLVDARIVVLREVCSQTGLELNKSDLEVSAGHVLLPAKPVPEASPDMWFHIVSGRKSMGHHKARIEFSTNQL
jgi:hypothetical protein